MRPPLDRRTFVSRLAGLGVTSAVFANALLARVRESAEFSGKITQEMVDQAAEVAGLHFTPEQEQMMLSDLNNDLKSYQAIHELHLANSVYPALIFNPVLPGMKVEAAKRPERLSRIAPPAAPKNLEDVAFYTARQLSELVRAKKVSSVALTQMYLERLKRYDPVLHFVVNLTEDRALAQAKEADADLARGKYRGPLHGLPWGAKDLLAAKGYKTTWGAGGFENQVIDEDATVVKRLDAAGAVLVAKLTLGALAMGDVWYGGKTRNPWKPSTGSSGSSAGPASATAAGCVAFSIGSETLGSISSPSTVCGDTGLRPTFGRVPRTGAMALSWSMDKLGPICRCAEDCGMVLQAIYGPDGQDPTVHDVPFSWDAMLEVKSLRVGYLAEAFEHKPQPEEKPEQTARRVEQKKFDDAALEVLRTQVGLKLISVELPKLPYNSMRFLLEAEAAAAFDELTRSGRDKLLTAQGPNDWPNSFRAARLIPAVEYINANRARVVGMRAMAELFDKVDVLVTPTFGAQLTITNLTGHPAVILPIGFRAQDGTPTSITFLGKLFAEDKLLAVAHAYQRHTEFHLKHPTLSTTPVEMEKSAG